MNALLRSDGEDAVREFIDAHIEPFSPTVVPAASRLDLRRVSPADWQDKPVPPRRWAVDGIMPDRNVITINGDGGLGKTLLALQLLVATTLSQPWLGFQTRGGPTLGVFCEDDDDDFIAEWSMLPRIWGVILLRCVMST